MTGDGTSTFTIQINGGEEQQLTVNTGIYQRAVAAVPAFFDVEWPLVVKIWVPRLLPDYGPYFYRVQEDEFGRTIVSHALDQYPR